MDWLNALNTQWAPVLWILLAGVFLLIWYLALRGKHRLEIINAAIYNIGLGEDDQVENNQS